MSQRSTQQNPAATTTSNPNIGAQVDKAQEKASTDERARMETQRDEQMREQVLLAPDDYKARMRAQTHVAAQELHSDETQEGGRIIDRFGNEVDAEGKVLKAASEE